MDRATLVERVLADAAERGEIASTQLLHAAAVGWPTHHLIADAERVHDVQRQQRNVRRLEHVQPV